MYEIHEDLDLDAPVLLMALEGWIDAGAGAARATAALTEGLESVLLASFDTDELLDHRARRPVVELLDGINTGLIWPTIELRAATDDAGHDVLLLIGAEPDHTWRAFANAAVDLAQHFGARLVLGLGAYPAPVPHTRPTGLSATATTPELAQRVGFVGGAINVPAGVQAAIERRCAEVGLPATGLWAQVPHYAAAMPYPAAAAALIDGVSEIGGLVLDSQELHDEAAATRLRLDALVGESDEHRELVHQLELHVDTEGEAEDGPPMELQTGDELAAELERFLRDQDT
jgi:proteasome assembly chaperone (PAC2) family protein